MPLRMLMVAATIACATLAEAATELEKFQKVVAKVAPAFGARPKALCFCATGDAFQGRAGFVEQFVSNGIVMVRCVGRTYTPNGDLAGGYACTIFEPLVK